jgi:hypothetical protein
LTGLTGFSGFIFDRFPEGNGQIQSPSAKPCLPAFRHSSFCCCILILLYQFLCIKKVYKLPCSAQSLSTLTGNIDNQRILSPEAMEFCHSHPENGKKVPVNPVNPV